MGSGGEQAAQITARPSLGQVGQTSVRSDTVEDKLSLDKQIVSCPALSPVLWFVFSVLVLGRG